MAAINSISEGETDGRASVWVLVGRCRGWAARQSGRMSRALLRRRGEAGASGWRGRVARWLWSALLALDSRKVAAGRVFGHLVRSE
jgi:hypothetical protein